jgi:hypothetical protein
MRIVFKANRGAKAIRVYFDPMWSEYRTRFFTDNSFSDAQDYFTTDVNDAVSTGCYWLENVKVAA